MNVAIIDSGLCSDGILKHKICGKVNFIHKQETDSILQNTIHGTTCAEIIADICPATMFLDLKALGADGTTSISNLLEALDWCRQYKIRLIHLSLGTANYFDIKPLAERVKSLAEQGAVMVAAYHNRNIKSYPAAFPKVFGVRQDREGLLERGQFFFQAASEVGLEIERENRLVAHWWGEAGMERANSYAAPVITGYAAKVLSEGGDTGFLDVLRYLTENSRSDIRYSQSLQNLIIKRTAGNAIGVPVIAGVFLSSSDINALVEFFKVQEYQVVLLQEKVTETNAIPLGYYGSKGLSLSNLLYTVDMVYKPDVIIMDFLTEEMYEIEQKQEIDMVIYFYKGSYQISLEGKCESLQVLEDVTDRIYRYFV